MNPAQLFLDPKRPFTGQAGILTADGWRFLKDIQSGLTTIDLTSQVTGILPVVHGGTGSATFPIISLTSGVSGVLPFANGGTAHSDLQFTTSGATNVTLPTTGTLIAQNTAITGTTITASTQLTASASVNPDGGGMKHQRVSTGSLGPGVGTVVTLTWPTAFADANYTVVVSVLDTTAADASLSIIHIESQSAAAITVRVLNSSAGNITGTLQAIAMHD